MLGLVRCVTFAGSSTDEEEIEPRPVLLGVMIEGTDSGICTDDTVDFLLTKEGSGRSRALGRNVSALASRKALWRVVSLMNWVDVKCEPC